MPKKAKSKRKQPNAHRSQAYAASALSVAMQNLMNMAVVMVVSGAVLLGLLAAKHF
jgi:hypothetical protein